MIHDEWTEAGRYARCSFKMQMQIPNVQMGSGRFYFRSN